MLTQDGKLTDIGAWYLNERAQGNTPKGAGSRPGPASIATLSTVLVLVSYACTWVV